MCARYRVSTVDVGNKQVKNTYIVCEREISGMKKNSQRSGKEVHVEGVGRWIVPIFRLGNHEASLSGWHLS